MNDHIFCQDYLLSKNTMLENSYSLVSAILVDLSIKKQNKYAIEIQVHVTNTSKDELTICLKVKMLKVHLL